jgi:hypothetical protein
VACIKRIKRIDRIIRINRIKPGGPPRADQANPQIKPRGRDNAH